MEGRTARGRYLLVAQNTRSDGLVASNRQRYSIPRALSVCTVAFALAACGGTQAPIGGPGAMPLSRVIATHAERGAVPSYLYVADASAQQPAIIAFDAAGNKVAEKTFKSGGPVDVVTDSRGHVYAIVYNKSYDSSVFEYTHNLDRTIAEYHPPNSSTTMTIDAADNLYVQSESSGGVQENIVRYRYGSTKVDHTYHIVTGPTNEMLGISVRGNTLYTLIAAYTLGDQVVQCDIKGAKLCQYYNATISGLCGFTTAHRDYVYAPKITGDDRVAYNPIGKPFNTYSHSMRLPDGYRFNALGGCIFHSYGSDVWVTLQGDSKPAEAAEIDFRRKVVKRTIGAGFLVAPNAAYYGNGFRR